MPAQLKPKTRCPSCRRIVLMVFRTWKPSGRVEVEFIHNDRSTPHHYRTWSVKQTQAWNGRNHI